MDLIAGLSLGFETALSPAALMFCFFGVSIGMFIGVLPGIGPLAAVAMILPVPLGQLLPALVVMLLALAIIAGAALLLDNPLILEWHNAGGFFADPIQSVCGMALLTYQLGYFNILPLYVLLIVVGLPIGAGGRGGLGARAGAGTRGARGGRSSRRRRPE